MIDLQKQISMCARHHSKWKRAAEFAVSSVKKKKYMERALFWMEMQESLVSLWSMDQNSHSPTSRKRALEAKSNISVKLAGYGRHMMEDI